MGNPFFDLAVAADSLLASPDQAIELLRHYLQREPGPADWQQLQVQGCAADCLALLWYAFEGLELDSLPKRLAQLQARLAAAVSPGNY